MSPLGYHHTPETRAKISAAQLGKSKATKGKPKPPGFGAKVAAANSRRVLSAASRAKIAASLRGKPGVPWSAERRAAMSKLRMGNDHVQRASVKGMCVYCLGPATTEDHMIPRGRPGWNDPENVVLACHKCNIAKGNRTPAEWFEAIFAGHYSPRDGRRRGSTRTNSITAIG